MNNPIFPGKYQNPFHHAGISIGKEFRERALYTDPVPLCPIDP
ncbi:MAG: hypothetical protein ACOC0K_00660 [bacterium]